MNPRPDSATTRPTSTARIEEDGNMAEERVNEIKPRNQRGMPRPNVKNPGKLFRRVFKLVSKNYAWQMVVVLICIIVSVFASVQGTLFTKTLIDSYITPLKEAADAGEAVDYTPLVHQIVRVAVFYGLGVIAALVQSVTMTYVTQGTMKKLRDDLFAHMESLPIKYFDTHAHGDIMSVYTNDIDTLRQMISQSMPQIINSGITVVSVFISMLVLNVPLTLVAVAMVIVILFVSSRATRASRKGFVAQQRALGKIDGFIEETMAGERVVKVFNHEEQITEQFNKLNDELYESAYKANAFSNILGPINSQLGNASYVLCAIIGGVMAINQYAGFTVGALASFLTFNKNFSMPINQISMQANAIISALAGAERIFALMDEEPEKDDGYVTLVNVTDAGGKKADVVTEEEGAEITDDLRNKVVEGLVETDERTGRWAWKHYHKATDSTTYVPLEGDVTFLHVNFGYTDDKMVLHDIVLHAKPGQKVALVGSTGAGKTTITNLINRFYDIQDGKIRYDNININKIKKPDLRRSLGIVLQETNLFTGTVADNIRYGKLDATDEEVEAAAKLVNADGFIRRLPQGYNTLLHGNGSNLSQGQRQLIAIARAAIENPPVLILDEATSSIDTRTEKIVQSGMDKLMAGRTTFVIAHRLSTIRNSDMIIVLEHGRIVEQGSHEELLELKGRYYQLYTGKKPELAS
jgi:ATP-binding cassette subfamily B multidrug efflux pump